jgi:hypothetical protein
VSGDNITNRRSRWWAVAAGAVAVVAVVAVLVVRFTSHGSVGDRTATSPVGSTRDYLTGPAAVVVRFDDSVTPVMSALPRGKAACEAQAAGLGPRFASADLSGLIRMIPDGRLGELLIDEDALVSIGLIACTHGDAGTTADLVQLTAVHAAIRERMVSLGVTTR